jgi:hypothetical protein
MVERSQHGFLSLHRYRGSLRVGVGALGGYRDFKRYQNCTKTPHSTIMLVIICNNHPSPALFSDLLKEFCPILFQESALRNPIGKFRVFFGSSEIVEWHSTSLTTSPGLTILFPKTQLASPENKRTVPKQIIRYSNH